MSPGCTELQWRSSSLKLDTCTFIDPPLQQHYLRHVPHQIIITIIIILTIIIIIILIIITIIIIIIILVIIIVIKKRFSQG